MSPSLRSFWNQNKIASSYIVQVSIVWKSIHHSKLGPAHPQQVFGMGFFADSVHQRFVKNCLVVPACRWIEMATLWTYILCNNDQRDSTWYERKRTSILPTFFYQTVVSETLLENEGVLRGWRGCSVFIS